MYIWIRMSNQEAKRKKKPRGEGVWFDKCKCFVMAVDRSMMVFRLTSNSKAVCCLARWCRAYPTVWWRWTAWWFWSACYLQAQLLGCRSLGDSVSQKPQRRSTYKTQDVELVISWRALWRNHPDRGRNNYCYTERCCQPILLGAAIFCLSWDFFTRTQT